MESRLSFLDAKIRCRDRRRRFGINLRRSLCRRRISHGDFCRKKPASKQRPQSRRHFGFLRCRAAAKVIPWALETYKVLVDLGHESTHRRVDDRVAPVFAHRPNSNSGVGNRLGAMRLSPGVRSSKVGTPPVFPAGFRHHRPADGHNDLSRLSRESFSQCWGRDPHRRSDSRNWKTSIQHSIS